MSRAARRRLALAALPVLFVAHDDFFLWDDPRIVMGLPAGMTWHLAYCLAAAAIMAWLVRDAWPSHLEVETAREDDGSRPGAAARGARDPRA